MRKLEKRFDMQTSDEKVGGTYCCGAQFSLITNKQGVSTRLTCQQQNVSFVACSASLFDEDKAFQHVLIRLAENECAHMCGGFGFHCRSQCVSTRVYQTA